jgi:hypothetical protein
MQHVSWAEMKERRNVPICTKSLWLSNVVHKYVYIPVSEPFSFAKIIHPPDRCGISRSWFNSMIITQVHLVLGKIKGHSKMCISHLQCRFRSFGCMSNRPHNRRPRVKTSTSGFFTWRIVWDQLRSIFVCNKARLWGKTNFDWLGLAPMWVGLAPKWLHPCPVMWNL